MTLIANALCFAAQMHAEQTDKNGQPYIWHPIRVAQGLKNAGYPETYQVVGLLHDVVEDTEATLEQVGKKFGGVVLGGVDAMTRRGHFEYPSENEREAGRTEWVWNETYKEYIARCCEHLVGRKVKRYDVYDNADPRRYCQGVPTGRYIWTLDHLDAIEKGDVITQWEGIHRSGQ